MNALTLNLKSVIEMTDEQFFRLCQNNSKWVINNSPPVGGRNGK
jgi:hypothetical protein